MRPLYVSFGSRLSCGYTSRYWRTLWPATVVVRRSLTVPPRRVASCAALESSSFVTAEKSDGLYGLSSGKVVTDTSSAAIGFGAAETSLASRFTCQSPGARKLKPLPRTVLGAELPLDEPPPPHADYGAQRHQGACAGDDQGKRAGIH